MRTTIEPPPTSRCDRCGGQLTLKRVDAAHSIFGTSSNVFVCTTCGRERKFVVRHDPLGSQRITLQSRERA